MSEISEVYNKETYLPFLAYCEENALSTMRDLSKCPFQRLSALPGISSLLASRIHAVYLSYCKARRDEAPARAMTEPELVNFLHRYFADNGERLLRLDDLVKVTEGRARRVDITKILRQVCWCNEVDKATFFFAGDQRQ